MTERSEYTDKRSLVMLHPDDCVPPHAADDAKMQKFIKWFEKAGFDKDHPAIIGYPFNGKIQLLSGSHRWAAAKETNTMLPVTLWLKSDVEKAWGDLVEWAKIMKQIPVKDFYETPRCKVDGNGE